VSSESEASFCLPLLRGIEMPNLGRREPYPPIGPAHDPASLYRQMMEFLLWLEERIRRITPSSTGNCTCGTS